MKSLGTLAKKLPLFMELLSVQEIKTLLLKNKNSVTTISKIAVEKELKEKKLFEITLINLNLKREFSLIYHKEKSQNLLFKTCVDFIKKSIKN